ncbi:MAG: putative Glyoxalase/dioxygenase [Bradyrhizobium sp.]|nr:putative Glyoxalase/dioxygenase [Bradyrhizobium sp.]
MLHHIMLRVADTSAPAHFIAPCWRRPESSQIVSKGPEGRDIALGLGFGTDNRAVFWLAQDEDRPSNVPLAFVADGSEGVDAFHRTALIMGARDNGAPALRSAYHAGYYAAFVIDLDGNNIEAVHLQAES